MTINNTPAISNRSSRVSSKYLAKNVFMFELLVSMCILALMFPWAISG